VEQQSITLPILRQILTRVQECSQNRIRIVSRRRADEPADLGAYFVKSISHLTTMTHRVNGQNKVIELELNQELLARAHWPIDEQGQTVR
jgi:hypothetical protein